MPINRSFFFEHAQLSLFDGKLGKSQKDGITAIVDRWEATMPKADDRWLAYMLATAHHETGRMMQPVRETFASTDDKAIAILDKAWNAGRLPWVKQMYWRKDPSGKSWLGRGLVQITFERNYKKLGDAIGEDLVARPERAMDDAIAIGIMFKGMLDGLFTGKKLGDFFNAAKEDWDRARQIINGMERAQLVGSYGRKYYACLSYTTG